MNEQDRKMRHLVERFYEDPDDVLIEKLLEVIEETGDTNTKFEAIKMIGQIREEYIC